MKTLIINFTGGKPLSLRMPAETATALLVALAADPNGTTSITTDNGNAYLVVRARITYVTSEDE